jgi:hypothetical protein
VTLSYLPTHGYCRRCSEYVPLDVSGDVSCDCDDPIISPGFERLSLAPLRGGEINFNGHQEDFAA